MLILYFVSSSSLSDVPFPYDKLGMYPNGLQHFVLFLHAGLNRVSVNIIGRWCYKPFKLVHHALIFQCCTHGDQVYVSLDTVYGYTCAIKFVMGEVAFAGGS